jgi:hypothetical protein
MRKFLSNFYRGLPVVRGLVRTKNVLADLQRNIERLNQFHMLRLLDFDLSDHPRYGDPKRLLRYQQQICSQNGEDGIIQEVFRRIGMSNQIFAEIGVGNGYENNSAFLLSMGWTGYWIDGDDTFTKTLNGRPDLVGGCIKWLVSRVTKENVTSLFQQLAIPAEFDLLSIDIDQNTYSVWEGLSGFRPRVVVIEYNAAIPPDIEWKVRYHPERTWDGTQNFGASLKAYEMLGRKLGYSLVGCELVGANAFFVRNDLVGDKFTAPYTAENHYEPPRYQMQIRRSHRSAILDRTIS